MKKLKSEYDQFFAHYKIYIGLSAIFYFSGFIIGVLAAFFLSDIFTMMKDDTELVQSTTQKEWISYFFHILTNNIQVSVVLIICGFLFFLPGFLLLINGIALGLTFQVGVSYAGLTNTLMFLIHNLFEIPAIILAGAVGNKIAYTFWSYLVASKDEIDWNFMKFRVRTILLVILLLLLIAAIIETILVVNIIPLFT